MLERQQMRNGMQTLTSQAIEKFILIFLFQLLPSIALGQNNKLHVITSQTDDFYHPLDDISDGLSYPFYFIHNPLFSLNHENKWTCRLCKEFPTVENGLLTKLNGSKNSYDLKIDFEFNQKYSWGDGKPINGYDLYFTWQVASKLDHRFLGKYFFNRIQQITVDSNNPHKVTVFLRGKSSLYSDWGEITLVPRHLEKKLWQKYQDQPKLYFKRSLYRSQPFNKGLYSGPYFLSEHASLTRAHNATEASLPYKVIKLTQAKHFAKIGAASEFLIPESLPKHYELISQQAKIKDFENQREIWGDSTIFEHVTFNLRNPILKDKRIRWALSHGFDKNELIRTIYNKLVSPAAHFLAPQFQGFNQNIRLFDHDIAKSKQLLDEAEWVYDEKSQTRYKMGKPLKLSLLTNRDPQRIASAKFLAKSWRKLGIEVEVKLQKNSQFWKSIQHKAYDSMIMFAWQLPVDRSYYTLFSSNAIPNIHNQYQGQNISGWVDQKVDQILNRIKNDFSEKNRLIQLRSLQEIFAEEVPMIPLFLPNQVALVPQRLNNFYISGNQFPSSHFIEEWISSQDKQLSAIR